MDRAVKYGPICYTEKGTQTTNDFDQRRCLTGLTTSEPVATSNSSVAESGDDGINVSSPVRLGDIIDQRWRVVNCNFLYSKRFLSVGGFGLLYEVQEVNPITSEMSRPTMALKLEPLEMKQQLLKLEVSILRKLEDKSHFCTLFGCGRTPTFSYMVMTLCGRNLAEVRRSTPDQRFSPAIAAKIGLQVLAALESLHRAGVIHRDIKPANFVLGLPPAEGRVFLIDFGLARFYVDKQGKAKVPRSYVGFRGTTRYASTSAHRHQELGLKDDLWSLFYVLVEFMQDELPWQKLRDRDDVLKLKSTIPIEVLCKSLPQELPAFGNYISTLRFADIPNYNQLNILLRNIVISK